MREEQDAKSTTWRDEREVRVRASPEQVWRAWADPEIIRQWFADEAEGRAEPGGAIVHRFPNFGFEHRYEVLEADEPHRLRLRAELGGRPFVQEVFVESAGGETVLRLVHSGFSEEGSGSSEEELEGIDSGWKLALAILVRYLENHFGRERETHFVMQPARFSYAELDELFRSEAGLARWLTRSGSIGDDGEPYELRLRDGSRAAGEVLAWTGREAALSWEEIAGTLELKAFGASADSRMLALRLMSWSGDPLPFDESLLRASLERLASAVAPSR
jgi:uncharacterized protein YndB with AHSA1/START domain